MAKQTSGSFASWKKDVSRLDRLVKATFNYSNIDENH